MVRKEVIPAIRMFLYIKVQRVSENEQDNEGLANLALHPHQQFRDSVARVEWFRDDVKCAC